MNMQNIDVKNPHHIWNTWDILDNWRFVLHKSTFEDLKIICIIFTWHFLNNDLSKYISSRYFVALKPQTLIKI